MNTWNQPTSLTYQWWGERIDTYVTKQFSYSRNFFHHIIARGDLLVNNKAVKKSYKLRDGDTISLSSLERYDDPVMLEEAPHIDIPVLLEHDDYLVIHKPKWVLSHPNSIRDVGSPSVVWRLYHRYKNLPTIGNFIRAGLVHRLDKDTNGVMLLMKSEKWLAHFQSLFHTKSDAATIEQKERTSLHKYYRATVHLTPPWVMFLEQVADHGYPFYIQEIVKPKVPHSIEKMGISKLLDVNRHDEYTATINIEILTGRTHQIRYHLSHHWLPIVGDYLYGIDEQWPVQLTAYRLVFEDSDGEIQEVHI